MNFAFDLQSTYSRTMTICKNNVVMDGGTTTQGGVRLEMLVVEVCTHACSSCNIELWYSFRSCSVVISSFSPRSSSTCVRRAARVHRKCGCRCHKCHLYSSLRPTQVVHTEQAVAQSIYSTAHTSAIVQSCAHQHCTHVICQNPWATVGVL